MIRALILWQILSNKEPGQRNSKAGLVLVFCVRSLALKLFAITFASVAALLVWVKSLAFPFHYFQANDGWNNPDAVQEVWPLSLVRPKWVGDAGNFDALEWLGMEMRARLWFMLAIWLVSVALTTYRYVRQERLKPSS